MQLWEKPTVAWGVAGPNGRRKDGRGLWDRAIPLDPYLTPGDPTSGLVPLVEAGQLGTIGSAAPGVQAYCYRLCLTDDPSNRRPIEPPADYSEAQYELVARYLDACAAASDKVDLRWFTKSDALPNRKFDFNTAYLGTNLPSLGVAYLEASGAEREKLRLAHENHARGLLHFLASCSRVPASLREEVSRYGLCRSVAGR